MRKRTRTTLSIDAEVLEKAHAAGINVSRFLENSLKIHLEGGSQQPQLPLEQPNQSPKELNLKNLFPPEALEKLKAYGFDVNDSEWLRRVIRDSLNKTIVELGFEIFDPKTGAYMLLE